MEFPSNVYELCSLHSVNCCLKVLSINNDGKRSSYVSRITPKRKTMALQEESARAVGRSENQDGWQVFWQAVNPPPLWLTDLPKYEGGRGDHPLPLPPCSDGPEFNTMMIIATMARMVSDNDIYWAQIPPLDVIHVLHLQELFSTEHLTERCTAWISKSVINTWIETCLKHVVDLPCLYLHNAFGQIGKCDGIKMSLSQSSWRFLLLRYVTAIRYE